MSAPCITPNGFRRSNGWFQNELPFRAALASDEFWSAAAPREGQLSPHPGSEPDSPLPARIAISLPHFQCSHEWLVYLEAVVSCGPRNRDKVQHPIIPASIISRIPIFLRSEA